jgi:Tfp pilus assembly protein PilZ
MDQMNYKIGQEVWVFLNAPGCNGIGMTGTVVGFTPKRIKCEVNGFVANYSPGNVEAKGIKIT